MAPWTRFVYFGIKNYWKVFAAMILATYFIKQFGDIHEYSEDAQPTISRQNFKTRFPETYTRNKPKILLWTSFFGSMKWYEDGRNEFVNVCNSECILTKDKNEIETADAVVFHLSDITWPGSIRNGFQFRFPKYRRLDQVWILYNLEPITMIYGNLGGWQGVFNWTWSYTKDSDVYAPYGQYRHLTVKEMLATNTTAQENTEHFEGKTKRGLAIISNCVDDARRYKLIEYLKKFIEIDVFGKCGKALPDKENFKSSYQFYLAFENSDCREYVTEKYWSTLMRNQIPVVAWKLPMDGLVIPNSYINIYDFKDLARAGAYIKRVSENKTLYNSYFDWKMTYKQLFKMGFCTLCQNLKDDRKNAQVYNDLKSWLSNSVCEPVSIRGFSKRVFDRFMFDGRLH